MCSARNSAARSQNGDGRRQRGRAGPWRRGACHRRACGAMKATETHGAVVVAGSGGGTKWGLFLGDILELRAEVETLSLPQRGSTTP